MMANARSVAKSCRLHRKRLKLSRSNNPFTIFKGICFSFSCGRWNGLEEAKVRQNQCMHETKYEFN